MESDSRYLNLGNGSMPSVGYGCWNLEKSIAAKCVKQAIRWDG